MKSNLFYILMLVVGLSVTQFAFGSDASYGNISGTAMQNQEINNIVPSYEVKQQIDALIFGYAYYYDSKNLDAWLNLFTNDAKWIMYDGNGHAVVSLDGKNGMRKFFEPRLAKFRQQKAQTRHVQTYTHFTALTDNSATVISYVVVYHQTPADPHAIADFTGYYNSVFIKINGEWKYEKRELFADQPLK